MQVTVAGGIRGSPAQGTMVGVSVALCPVPAPRYLQLVDDSRLQELGRAGFQL